jgi:hypothetical protein
MTIQDIRLKVDNTCPGKWTLLQEVNYPVPSSILKLADGPDVVIVKPGFGTDLASIPRGLWAVLPPFGRYSGAAVVHDYLYQSHEGSRKFADLVFLEAMRELEVKWLKRRSMYRAVRMFGGGPWKRSPLLGGVV